MNKSAVKERVLQSLGAAVRYFRTGSDEAGVCALMAFADDLEWMLDMYEFGEETWIEAEPLLPAVSSLYTCMQNQDIAGMADLLEYTLHPMLEKILGGEENDDHSRAGQDAGNV